MTLDKTKQTEKNPYANKTKPVQKKKKKCSKLTSWPINVCWCDDQKTM